jgi:hypothetical protein
MKSLPTIPPCFLRNDGKRGKPSLAKTDPKTIQKLMLAVFLDEKLTDADHAARHGVSVLTVRKYTSWLKWNRRHASLEVVQRNSKAIVGKVSMKRNKAKQEYAFVELEPSYAGA